VCRFVPYGMVCLTLIGCGQSTTVGQPNIAYDRLFWIGQAYTKATDELNRGPANRNELIPYLQERGDPSDIFRSDRDNEDFVILWNVDYREYLQNQRQRPVIAYEKTGNKGFRYVLQVRVISRLNDEDFKKAPFPDGHQAPF
jgi:hypothetical protein